MVWFDLSTTHLSKEYIKIVSFDFNISWCAGVEWGEPSCAGLWKQGVDTQTG